MHVHNRMRGTRGTGSSITTCCTNRNPRWHGVLFMQLYRHVSGFGGAAAREKIDEITNDDYSSIYDRGEGVEHVKSIWTDLLLLHLPHPNHSVYEFLYKSRLKSTKNWNVVTASSYAQVTLLTLYWRLVYILNKCT